MTFLFHFFQFLVYIPFCIIFPTKVVGRKNLKKGKMVICMNHTSNFDAPLFASKTFERKYYLAKIELFKGKFKSGFLKLIGAMPIDRVNPSLNSIKNALGVLRKNKKLVIFPEGTRKNDLVDKGEIGETKNGAAMFAIKSKSPIVPVWINRKPKAFRLTKYIIGEPFELSEFYDKKLDEQTLNEAGAIINQKLIETGKKYTNGKI